MQAIEVSHLTKQYKNGVCALDNLSLSVRLGEIFCLLGPNGAGKSSLINILTTYTSPTSGAATILGRDLGKEPTAIRAEIACVAQAVSIDTHLSLRENMLFQSRLYKLEKTTAIKRIDTLIECFGLSQYLQYPVSTYSGGVKRRLDIAMNMVSYPRILFLDEPTVGLDILSRKAMWDILQKIKGEFNTTIFMTTHYLEEAEQLSDTICIMKNGREIVQGDPVSLRRYIRQKMLCIGFENLEAAQSCAKMLTQSKILPSPRVLENAIVANITEEPELFKAVNQWLLHNQISFNAIQIMQPGIEDVFLNLTGEGM